MKMKSSSALRLSIHSLVVSFLLGAAFADASIALVQHKTNSGAASSNKLSISIARLGAGNLVVIGVCSTGTSSVSSITDNGSTANTYKEAAGTKSTNGPSMCDFWYAANSHAGASSISVTFNKSGTFEKNIEVWEVSGI